MITLKSCIKAAAYVQFFGAAIQVWLSFKSGLCTHVQSLESAKPVNAVWHM